MPYGASCGLQVAGWLELPDHCPYGLRELAQVVKWLDRLDIEHVVCTRKDLVKMPRDALAGRWLWALEIELEVIRGKEDLERRLELVVSGER